MSSNSKQKGSKQPFEQQLHYISECISVYFAKKGLTPTLTVRVFRFLAAVRKGFLVLPRCDDALVNQRERTGRVLGE